MNRIRLAAAALNQTPMEWDTNVSHIRAALASARDAGVGILCLPELCITGYGCEDMFFSAGIQRRSLELLEELLPVVAMSLEILQRNLHTEELLGQTREQAAQRIGREEVRGIAAGEDVGRAEVGDLAVHLDVEVVDREAELGVGQEREPRHRGKAVGEFILRAEHDAGPDDCRIGKGRTNGLFAEAATSPRTLSASFSPRMFTVWPSSGILNSPPFSRICW